MSRFPNRDEQEQPSGACPFCTHPKDDHKNTGQHFTVPCLTCNRLKGGVCR